MYYERLMFYNGRRIAMICKYFAAPLHRLRRVRVNFNSEVKTRYREFNAKV